MTKRYLAMFFGWSIVFSSSVVADSVCHSLIPSDRPFGKLVSYFQDEPVGLREFQLEIYKAKRELEAKQIALGIFPFDSSVSIKPYRRITLEEGEELNRIDSTLSATVDISELMRGNNSDRATLEYRSALIEFDSAKAAFIQASVVAVLDYKEAVELESIFLNRITLLEENLKYLLLTESYGQSMSTEKRRVESDLLDLRARLDAVLIKKGNSLAKLQLTDEPEIFAGLKLGDLLRDISFTCRPDSNLDVMAATVSKLLSAANILSVESRQDLGVSIFGNIVSEYDSDLQRADDRLTVGVEFTLPLLDGGSDAADIENALADHQRAMWTEDSLLERAKLSIIDWSNTRKTLEASLGSYAQKADSVSDELVKKLEKKRLGGSVFEEFIDLSIQASELSESAVNVSRDLLAKYVQLASDYRTEAYNVD
jgi:outer membrane protein TolC